MRILVAVVLAAAVQACFAGRRSATDAAVPPSTPQLTPLPRAPQIVSYEQSFTERVNGDSAGTMSLAVWMASDSVLGTISGVRGDSVFQHVVAVFPRDSLRARTISDSSNTERLHLTYAGERVVGTIRYPNRIGAFNTIAVNGRIGLLTIDRRSLVFVTQWLPLESGYVYTFMIYDSRVRRVYPVDISIGVNEPIIIPAGTFQAYRLDVTARLPVNGSAQSLFPTVLWVRADSLRHILRIERPNRRQVYELTTYGHRP